MLHIFGFKKKNVEEDIYVQVKLSNNLRENTLIEFVHANGFENVYFRIGAGKLSDFGFITTRDGSPKPEEMIYSYYTIRKYEDIKDLYALENKYKIYVDSSDNGSLSYYLLDFIKLIDDGYITVHLKA